MSLSPPAVENYLLVSVAQAVLAVADHLNIVGGTDTLAHIHHTHTLSRSLFLSFIRFLSLPLSHHNLFISFPHSHRVDG